MKKYIKPELAVSTFETEDVITASSAATSAPAPKTFDYAEYLGTVYPTEF